MAIEVRGPEELEHFLSGKPFEWSRLIAARSALRVLPAALVTGLPETVWSPALRACFISWSASRFPAYDMKSAARSAASFAARSAADSAYSVAGPASFAARSAADSAYSVAGSAAPTAAHSAAVSALSAAESASSVVWQMLCLDLALLADNFAGQPMSLALQPLWYGTVPDWTKHRWQAFTSNMRASNKGYTPWIGWYNALLTAGSTASADFFGEELTIRIATQSDIWWSRPSSEVNADIARWLAERDRGDDVPSELDQAVAALPPQGAAPFLFEQREDQIYALPATGTGDPTGVLQDYLDDARDKAKQVLQRLRRSNVDAYVPATVESLLSRLPINIGDVRPALVDSRRLSIVAIARAYSAPGAEDQLFPDAIAQFLDLSLTLDRFCSRLPELRAMEADELARAVDPGNAQELLDAANDAIGSIENSHLLHSSASEALSVLQADAVEQAPPEAKTRRVIYLLETLRNLLLELFRLSRRPVAAVLKEMRGVMKDGYGEFRPKLVKGVERGLSMTFYGGLAYVVETVASPLGKLASLAGFKNIDQVVQLFQKLLS